MTNLSGVELENYLWGAAILLRNKIDPGDYKGYIFPLLFLKRISDVYDEEYQKALDESDGDNEYAKLEINHRFQIPNGYHWNDLRKISANVGLVILKNMRTIEKRNPLLYGIFGDSNWGNKERLSDETLTNLIEHFSSKNLSLENVPNDEMGNSYEFLIKKFADDSGHTAAEFYTNRTLVTLMTMILNPKPNESIYDPTCGTGGMLLESINFLKRNKKEYRNLKIYGQEKNIITSSIARMNMFLHGVEDFNIQKGDTLEEPLFLTGDEIQQFDCILANPPYSISKWNQKSWSTDPYARNIYGVPPKSRADYAFLQHIVKSLNEKNGRAAILFPHGVLFRDAEFNLRKNLVEDDKIEAILGLGPNLFYNSPMEVCVVILKDTKKQEQKNKVLFIDAKNEITKESNQSFLSNENIHLIFQTYKNFETKQNISYLASIDDIREKNYLLSVQLYVKKMNGKTICSLNESIPSWLTSSKGIHKSLPNFLEQMEVFSK